MSMTELRRPQREPIMTLRRVSKVALAKWLVTNPAPLILDEPTHGVDIAVLDVPKAGKFTTFKDGEVVYGKPLIFTKDTVGKYNF